MIEKHSIILADFETLDKEAYCSLQQQSFAKLFQSNEIDNSYLDPEFFDWKYNSPAGAARIAFVQEEGKMIASVAMCPMYLVKAGSIFKSWHFVEAATLPEARGRGLFIQCMSLLVESLDKGEMIYVFPNGASGKGVTNLGFKQLTRLGFYGRVIISRRGQERALVGTGSFFTSAQDEYALQIPRHQTTMVLRDAAYMNWRYNGHPHATYYSFAPEQKGSIMGNIVVRAVKIKGVMLLLVMEFHAVNKAVEKQLLQYLKEVARVERCSLAAIFSTKANAPSFLSTGLFKVPSFLLPKKHLLMGIRSGAPLSDHTSWFCQTGDWDAF
jgi:hypothetical protein